ncbi:CpsD/CapB family tyrosine-protein kinase [Vannielia sp. SX4]|uniref:CpsD/CapB family tyrosine-protein kinase n=1 Tax=Vannielia sp. SX4 TaxID=3463852 RepID=UPI004057D108
MEKLQAAIDEARKRRSDGASATDRSRSEPATLPVGWAELPEFRPQANRLSRSRIVANSNNSARVAVDMLRTRLLRLMQENNWKRVMITSPNPGCGKTTVAANLALAMQRQQERRALLMDLDFAGSSLARTLGLEPQHDVSDLLEGTVSPSEQMVRIGDNLAISANRASRHDKDEVLKTGQAADVLDALEKELDLGIMIFDFPPFFANDSAIAGASFVDCAIIIGAAEQTSIHDIDMTERDLSQYTNIAGVVLNKCRYSSGAADSYNYPYR